jgi:hypothetical protein
MFVISIINKKHLKINCTTILWGTPWLVAPRHPKHRVLSGNMHFLGKSGRWAC